MKLNISNQTLDTICIPMYFEKKKFFFFNTKINEKLKKDIFNKCKLFQFNAEHEKSCFFEINNKKYLILGIKKNYSNEDLRKIYSNFFNIIKSNKEDKVTLHIPKENDNEIKAILEGIDLTNYSYDKYLSKKEKFNPQLNIDIDIKYKNLVSETLKVTKNIKFSRDFLNENADIMTPKKIESIVKDYSKKNKLKIKVLNEKQIEKEGLGLFHAVGKGSSTPARLIIVEYNGNPKSKEKTALIGKGLTFDTGGLNLKPTGFIEEMKLDKGGAATVFGIFRSAVDLKLKKNLILALGCTENAISNTAYKPGDIYKSYNGITVEITNTDAEGRLVLADTISYVQKKYSPSSIIDAATLTGACVVALGTHTIGMFGNNKNMKKQILNARKNTDELIWELPIFDEHKDALKSKIADTLNCAIGKGKYGGASSAAAFIEKFVDPKVNWVHLDVAGAAWGYSPYYYHPQFATGKGIRLIIEYLKNN